MNFENIFETSQLSQYTIEILGYNFILFNFIINTLIACIFLYIIYKICLEIFIIWFDYKRAEKLKFIQIKIPRQDAKEEKDEMGEEYGQDKTFIKLSSAMTQLFDGFSSLKSGTFVRKHFTKQDYMSLEYIVDEGMIKYVLGIPASFIQSASKQITALYPTSIITPIKKTTHNRK